jgi:eukaryotic-like serine/threonine-protein kinase
MTTVPQDPSGSLPALGDAYTIERELGGGGMSRVFVATDRALERKVVVKLLSTEVAQGLSAERFAREIKLAAQLQDPHIVPVLATGTTLDGVPYYTMPFVPGESLRARMNAGTVPLEESLRILRDVAEALEHAHEQGVVHRDIKPENILISGRNAVVADFGIAKALTAARSITAEQTAATLTSVGMSLGTPRYMAPEQAAGDATDHRADLYAWGMIAYELLAGVHPFAAKTTTQQLIMAQITEVPRPLDEVRPGLPPSLGALVMQCLAKHAADRPENTTALLAELAGAASGSTSGARTGTTGTTMPAAVPTRSRRGLVLAGVGLLAVLGAGGVFMTKRGAAASNVAAMSASPSLAVLPFEHQGDSADVYLTEGITDEIRGKLSGVRDLLVIARTSSNSYRNTKKSPQQIAEELGVRYLLTGTVRVVGSGAERRVIVRPELVEITREGKPQSRWGQPFDVGGADVLGLQGEVATQVVTAMEVPIAGGSDRGTLAVPTTRDPVAYDLLLRARAATDFNTDLSIPALQASIRLYEQVLARDSTMVDAWVELARSLGNLQLSLPSSAVAEQLRRAAERTKALDPSGARGERAMSFYLRAVKGDQAASLAAAERALRADPTDAVAANAVANGLFGIGRVDEGLQRFSEALRLDPRNGVVLRNYARYLALRGRIAEARAMAERLHAVAPLAPTTIDTRIFVALAAGDTAAVRRFIADALQRIPQDRLLPTLVDGFGVDFIDRGVVRAFIARGPEAAAGGERALWFVWQAYEAYLAGDRVARQAWGDSARRELAPQIRALPTNPGLRSQYAQALAHAGRGAEAIRETREAMTLVLRNGADRRSSAYFSVLSSGAFVAILVGEHATALDLLEEQAALPMRLSRDWLRVDPSFAPLRGNPRFERLTAEAPR